MDSLWLTLAVLTAAAVGYTLLRGAPYVPTHRRQVEKAFTKLVQLSPDDVVVDLGAGDGIVLDQVRRQGARAVGFEINPLLVLLMKLRFWHQPRVSVKLQDYLVLDELPPATTVVYAFATSRDIKKIDQKMRQWSQKQSLMLISYGFEIAGQNALKTEAPFKLYHYASKSLQQ